MKNYSHEIIKMLIAQYEKSKTSIGKNKINRKISLRPEKIYPKYSDPSEYDFRQAINGAIEVLIAAGVISSVKQRNNMFSEISLVLDEIALADSYAMVSKIPKKDKNQRLKTILLACVDSGNKILQKYAIEQLRKLEENHKVEYFDEDFEKYINILRCAYEVQQLKEEVFYRNFSMELFHNSKYFEHEIQSKVESLLFKYGEFGDKEKLLAELNLIKTPSSINIKGNVRIIFLNGKVVDIKGLEGGLGFSTVDIQNIDSIQIEDSNILTVENLTNYYTSRYTDYCIIYLGGFTNHFRRVLLRKIYEENPHKSYYHFGDIDAGGFYILQHLINKTDIPFLPLHMNIETLERYRNNWEQLTENDIKRLKGLLESPYQDTIQFMLNNNCKLEQEAII